MARAGGFLVSELKLHLERMKSRWTNVLFLLGAAAGLALLSSCGAASTAVTPTMTVSCTPLDVTVLTTSTCTASPLNVSSSLVNWSISPTTAGSITAGGIYTAPSTVPTNNIVTITATSQALSTLTATQTLTIEQATAISAVTCVDPTTNPPQTATIVSSGNELDCTATASTGAIVAVNWSVANATKGLAGNVGSISSQGIYTAPAVPPPGQKINITATSQEASAAVPPVTVTVTVVFGTSVLSGNYVFSTSGKLPSGAFWARAGSFSAGGGVSGGVINGGLEDTNQGGAPNTAKQLRSFTGSYAVGADGRGTMQFCEDTSSPCPFGSSAATAFFRIVVASPQQVQLIEFSPPTSTAATTIASGEMILQDSFSQFSNANQILSGVYSFNFAGVSTSASAESIVGEFSSDGFQHIALGSSTSPGEMDTNAGGPVALPASTYTMASNFRGTITLNGLNFSFYPVSASQAKFIEIDQPSSGTTPDSILVGDAYKQQTSSTCGWTASIALTGTTVLETFGTASGFAVGDVGAFTASNGAVTLIAMDQNSGGTESQPAGTANDNYAMDSDKCGRGTLSVAGHSYVFYIISPSNAVLQETTSGTVAQGLLAASQSGSFADGSYAFRFQGVDAAGASGQTEVFLGQFASVTSSTSGTALNGTLDLNDIGATQTGLPITNGTYTASTGPRSAATLPIGNPVTTTRSLVLYEVSPTLFYVLDGVASSGPAIGVINHQF